MDWTLYYCYICRCPYIYVGQREAHHLIPREMGGTKTYKIYVCEDCHDWIHLTWSNADLAHNPWVIRDYQNTISVSNPMSFPSWDMEN